MNNEITKAERFNLGFDAVQSTWFCDVESDLSCMKTLPEVMWSIRNVQWQSEKDLAYIIAVAPPGIPFNLSSYIEPSKSSKAGIKEHKTSMECWHKTQEDIKERFFGDIEENRKGQCPNSLVGIYNSNPVIITFEPDEFIDKIKEHQDKKLLVSRVSPKELKLESAADYSEYVRYLYNHYKTKDDCECWEKNEFILRRLYPSHFIAIHNGDVAIIEKNHKKFMRDVETRYYDKPLLQVYVSKEKIDLDDIIIDDE